MDRVFSLEWRNRTADRFKLQVVSQVFGVKCMRSSGIAKGHGVGNRAELPIGRVLDLFAVRFERHFFSDLRRLKRGLGLLVCAAEGDDGRDHGLRIGLVGLGLIAIPLQKLLGN